MSVPLIPQKHLPFLVGVHTLNQIKWNGPMASNCIRHSLESVQEIKD